MAQIKISSLPLISGYQVDFSLDVIPIVDTSESTSKKITVTELATALFGGLTFNVVDTEAELEAALLVGGIIIIRGEITITSGKIISIPGTKIYGYGYKITGANHYSKLTLTTGSSTYGLYVDASDVEIAGFQLTTTASLNGAVIQYGIRISDTRGANRVNIHDMQVWGFKRNVSQDGTSSSVATEGLKIENNYFHTFWGDGVYLDYGVNRAKIQGNLILGRTGNASHACSGAALYLGNNASDNVIERNFFGATDDYGLKMISAGSGNSKNKVVYNSFSGLNGGISLGNGLGCLINGNTAINISGIGIYSYGFSGVGTNIISNNWITGVSSTSTGAGIKLDNTYNEFVYGNKVESITGANLASYGIQSYGAQFAKIEQNSFFKAGYTNIEISKGIGGNTSGYNVVSNNSFRSLSGYANYSSSGRAIFVNDTTCVVKDNTAWFQSGSSLSFTGTLNSPAKIYPGHSGIIVTTSSIFSDSNLSLGY